MKCIKCGNILNSDDAFCPKCGEKRREATSFFDDVAPKIDETKLNQSMETSKKVSFKNSLLKIMIYAIGICAFIEIFLIMISGFGEVQFKVVLTIFLILISGVLALKFITLDENTNHEFLALSGFFVIAITFIYSSLYAWDLLPAFMDGISAKILYALWIIAVGLTHAAKLYNINYTNDTAKNLLSLTSLVMIITYAMLVIIIFIDIQSEIFFRMLWIMIILSLLGTFATPMSNKIK